MAPAGPQNKSFPNFLFGQLSYPNLCRPTFAYVYHFAFCFVSGGVLAERPKKRFVAELAMSPSCQALACEIRFIVDATVPFCVYLGS